MMAGHSITAARRADIVQRLEQVLAAYRLRLSPSARKAILDAIGEMSADELPVSEKEHVR